MYIHFYMDSDYSQRFIEFINANFDKKSHLHIVISSQELKYVKEQYDENVYIVSMRDYKSLNVIKLAIKEINTGEIKCYHHFLSDLSIVLTYLLGLGRKGQYWILWGADLYSYINHDLYSPITTKYLVNKDESKRTFFKPNLRAVYRKGMLLARKRFLKSTSGILTWNKGDYELACNHYHIKPKHVDFVYNLGIKKDESIDEISNTYKEPLIMVGNSGDPTNNHIDIFSSLTKISGNFKVLSFLTYGDSQYIKKTIEAGYEILGDKFIPITNHMSREEYFSFIRDIDVVIMNHYRQQGVGNIVSFLQKGKKIYLNDFITTYEYFKENGVIVSPINELEGIFDIGELVEYDASTKIHNSNIIYELFSDERALEKMKEIFL